MSTRAPRRALAATLVAAAALTGACSTETTSADLGSTDATVEVTTIDYGYRGLPANIESGTAIALTNESAAELHELVAFRLDDNDDRSAEQLMALPEAELGQLLAGEPATVIIAEPGQAGLAVVGDGTLTEPGRYLVACFIPTGAVPAEYLAAVDAAAGEAPTGVAGGPPHFANGMFTEVTVQ